MNKNTIISIISAIVLSTSFCGCTKQKSYVPSESPAATEQGTKIELKKEVLSYNKGNVTCDDFNFFADPTIWNYTDASDDICDFRMKAAKELTICGITLFRSEEQRNGNDAQFKVLSVINDDDVVSTGTLATADRNFYYYEWSINEDLHGRTYIADCGNNYLCAYAESNNFGFVDGKIAELLSSIKLADEK